MKPLILIAGGPGGRINYSEAVFAAGGDSETAYLSSSGREFDGLLLTGGSDVDPSFYGEDICGSEKIDRERDKWELELFREFCALKKPVLGVCRGHQLINVALGGTLVQHIGDDLCRFHRRTPDHEGDKVHAVFSLDGSWYREIYGSIFTVNSAHHQALGRLGDGLMPVLWSESGIIEAVEHEELPVFSVQFHPERMTGNKLRTDTVDGHAVFSRFIGMCRERSSLYK